MKLVIPREINIQMTCGWTLPQSLVGKQFPILQTKNLFLEKKEQVFYYLNQV